MGEACDATFMLTGDISWVGKQAQLDANAVTLQDSQQIIAQDMTKQSVEARGSGHPHIHSSAVPPLSFSGQTGPLLEVRLPSTDECAKDPRCTYWTMTKGKTSTRPGLQPDETRSMGHSAPSPSPSPYHGFESD